MIKSKILTPLFLLMALTMPSYAETTVSAEVGFIFNTFLFLVCGFLVMFMAAGFAMLEMLLKIWDIHAKPLAIRPI